MKAIPSWFCQQPWENGIGITWSKWTAKTFDIGDNFSQFDAIGLHDRWPELSRHAHTAVTECCLNVSKAFFNHSYLYCQSML